MIVHKGRTTGIAEETRNVLRRGRRGHSLTFRNVEIAWKFETASMAVETARSLTVIPFSALVLNSGSPALHPAFLSKVPFPGSAGSRLCECGGRVSGGEQNQSARACYKKIKAPRRRDQNSKDPEHHKGPPTNERR